MFTSLLRDGRLERCDFSGELFPMAADRGFWGGDPAWIAAAEPYLDYVWPTIKATDWLAYRSASDRLAQETPRCLRGYVHLYPGAQRRDRIRPHAAVGLR